MPFYHVFFLFIGSQEFLQSLSWSIGPLVHWSIGLLVQLLNVKCQMSYVIYQMSNNKYKMSKIKCQMPKVNKVKLLSERTSGAPPVIFFPERCWVKHSINLFSFQYDGRHTFQLDLWFKSHHKWLFNTKGSSLLHKKKKIFIPKLNWMNMKVCEECGEEFCSGTCIIFQYDSYQVFDTLPCFSSSPKITQTFINVQCKMK